MKHDSWQHGSWYRWILAAILDLRDSMWGHRFLQRGPRDHTMKYSIEKDDEGLHVEVWDTANCQAAVLGAFQMCQAGMCPCPFNERDKLEDMRVEAGEDRVSLQFTARSGEQLDEQAIKKCLAITLGGARRAKRPAA